MKLMCIIGEKRSGKDTTASIIRKNRKCATYAFADPLKDVLSDVYIANCLANKSGVTVERKHWDGDSTIRENPLMLSNSDVVNYLVECLKSLSNKKNLKCKTSNAGGFEQLVKAIVMKNAEPWSLRRLMQILGTDIVVNKIDKFFWCRLAMNEYFDAMLKHDKFSKYDYFIISDGRQEHEIEFVRNMGAIMLFIQRDTMDKSKRDGHISEQIPQRMINEILIKNNGSIDDLEIAILKVLKND